MKGICFILFIIQSVSIRADSDPMIIEGIIQQDDLDAANSNEPRNGRQFQQLQARSSSSAKQNPEELISDIHCMRTAKTETFTAFLRLPQHFVSPPVLENVGTESIDPTQCLITRTNVEGIFALDLSKMAACGVRRCENGEEFWMCVTIRYPMLPGLKLPEDEVIDIKCKPQDPAISGSNVINFQENVVEQRSPTIYIGGGQEFLSEIGLFRRLPGTELFASRVKSGSTIELGENVQLRSIVRSGDGWNFAKITDVLVHRVHDGQALNDEKNTAELVSGSGCRNPAYEPLAPYNPWRDPGNGLINNFDFRVFMFQEMLNGDSIMISAKVVACVEEIDCAPVNCGANEEPGYGRKRRSVLGSHHHLVDNSTFGKTKNWQENLELKIRMPPDLLSSNENSKSSQSSNLDPRALNESECKLYLIITLSVALTFCVLSAMIVVVACFKKYQESKAIKHAQNLEQEEKEQMTRTEVKSVASSSNSKNNFESQNGGVLSNIPQHYFNSQSPHLASMAPNRPITVRSVKRRDKAKVEEKKMNSQQFKIPTVVSGRTPDERDAVVV